jgi:hypothetical protein
MTMIFSTALASSVSNEDGGHLTAALMPNRRPDTFFSKFLLNAGQFGNSLLRGNDFQESRYLKFL